MDNYRNIIINKLFNNQIENINPIYRLKSNDIIRLSLYLSSDPFCDSKCCKWTGTISISSCQTKYINFWFNKKKQALHRVLYINYIKDLPKNKYLKFICPDPNMKGICCNINHMVLINSEQITEQHITTTINPINNSQQNNIFIIVFEE